MASGSRFVNRCVPGGEGGVRLGRLVRRGGVETRKMEYD